MNLTRLTKEEPVIHEFKLALTKDEARTLRSVLGSVAGSPHTTRRKHSDDLYTLIGKMFDHDLDLPPGRGATGILEFTHEY